jgi:hypothetical protein
MSKINGVNGNLQFLETYIVPNLAKSITVYQLKWYCPAELLREIKVPVGWVDAVKERFAPKWLLRKYPIKYAIHKFYEMYPEVSFPPNSGHKKNIYYYRDIDA